MEFRIADTFTDSLARLNGDEQKAVKTTAFDLQMNVASPGLSFHKLDRAKDKNFWSVRVSSDIRLIVHKTQGSLLLCYVDHHDKAYDWAARRKLQTHPKTGAAQLVEVRETVQEILVPTYVEVVTPKPAKVASPLFGGMSGADLLGYGVPPEWIADVRAVTDDGLLALCDHLPGEASEALLELATGGKPRVPAPAIASVSPFDHPDAQRRFRVMTNVEELQRALEFPWDKWSVFLHPEQRQMVEREYSGPARVSGSAGTGKTIVALHRVVHVARANPDARVLLTTFSDMLANALHTKLRRLLGNDPRLGERIDVHSLDAIGQKLYRAHVGPLTLANRDRVGEMIRVAAAGIAGHKFGLAFLRAEWDHVVDAWQLDTWESYRDVTRLGRKTRLSQAQRRVLWAIFERVRTELAAQGLVTSAGMFTALAVALAKSKSVPFQFVVVDESQDLGVAHLRFLVALGRARADALFFAGDLGQRIFQQPFSWKWIGVDVRGRSRTLRVNYRTSHQIRTQADRLLAAEVSDVDGNREERGDTVSVFNGPHPTVRVAPNPDEEGRAVGAWLRDRLAEGVIAQEVGVFVRSAAQVPRARQALDAVGLAYTVLDERAEMPSGRAVISTMHLAKGLEFRVVVVMACDDEVVPLQERIEVVGDDADLKDVYDTERQLLYVACTRARDNLLVTAVEPASEFLGDMWGK